MTEANSRLAVILVGWNTRAYLEKCLDSLYRHYHNPDSEVWVVDNHSSDDSVAMVCAKFPQVHLLVNKENVGFARACNQAIVNAHAEYFLLLNSDCELQDNFIDPVLQVMAREEGVGVAGAVLLHANGRIQHSGGRLLTSKRIFFEQLFFRSAPVFAETREEFEKRNNAKAFINVEFVSGACLFIKRSVINKIGLLREDFFMYGEDVEFSLRAQKNGYATVVVTNAFVVHHKCKSTNKNLLQALRHGLINNTLIVAELQGTGAAMLILLWYFIGGWLRFFLALFRPGVSARDWFKLLMSYHKIVRAVVKKI